MSNLWNLYEKHEVIGDVRGTGCFVVQNLFRTEAISLLLKKRLVQAVVADCMAQGIIIGATNRSLPGLNNTLCFSPALIATPMT